MTIELLSDVWVEKYRPKSLDEYIDGSFDKELIRKFIVSPKDIPHLLLVSTSAGTGKTTCAQIIINSLDTDSIVLNSSMDRGIDIVRDRLNIFASTSNRNKDIPKLVFLDEADGLSLDAQSSLRNLMETYFNNCRFILTANNSNKIMDPIKSRCMQFNLGSPDKEKIKKRVLDILSLEGVVYNTDVVEKVINLHYPNIRNILVYLQKIYLETGNINYDITSLSPIEQKIYDLLKQKSYLKARDMWIESGFSAEAIINSFFKLVIDDTFLDDIKKKKIFMLLATYSYRMAVGADSGIQLMGFMSEVTTII